MRKIKQLLKSHGIELVIMPLEKNGYYNHIIRTMFVNENQSVDEIKRVIWHELGHGVLHEEFQALYSMPVPHSKMENEADIFMIDKMLTEYMSLLGISAEQVNYMKFIEDTELDLGYESTVKELLTEYIIQSETA